MTCVAWDGKHLAADRQATNSEMRRAVRKVHRLKTGELVAITGLEDGGRELIDWYEAGADRDKWPPLQATNDWVRMIVVRGAAVFEYGQRPVAIRINAPFFAWGSGRDFAMGALAAGASARRAVEIASRFNVYCGLGVDQVRVLRR